MAGPQTPVIKGNKAYGDQKALDSLARQGTGMKYDNAGPVTERRGAGRPTGSTAAPAPGVPGPAGAPAPGVPGSEAELMENFSRAALVAGVGQATQQELMAGPWLRKYAEFSQVDVDRKGKALQAGTPFFDSEF